ncbi:MAG TPA: hypothetical protein VFB92_29690 [Vicinamibacterales bacterium]|jgi:hypothetical protein|nr:hypothetical protein [Vicinamibacterales bacterium]
MPEVHVPKLEEHDEEPEPPAPVPQAERQHRRRGKSLLTIGLEVVLITTGVFLGLMGEQWRERSEQRELAETSLRRFRTEIMNNRKAVAAVTDYHAKLKRDLDAYFKLEPRTPNMLKIGMTMGVAPVFFEQAAWDLALATQSLAHIDSELAFALSRVYTLQQTYASTQNAIVTSTIYGRSWRQDFDGYWQSISSYLGDVSYFDPVILKAYDEVLPQIDRALGESPEEAALK